MYTMKESTQIPMGQFTNLFIDFVDQYFFILLYQIYLNIKIF